MHGLMKRGVIIISLLIISCLSFVGCGKKYISETKNMALPMTELRLGEANSKVEEILGKPDEDLSSESSSHLYYKYRRLCFLPIRLHFIRLPIGIMLKDRILDNLSD